MKYVELTFEDGEKWTIPLEFIAKHRANYYKSRAEERVKAGLESDFNYQESIDFIMEDDYEGEDWLANNMDYEDFKEVVIKYPSVDKIKVLVRELCEIAEIEGNASDAYIQVFRDSDEELVVRPVVIIKRQKKEDEDE